MNPEYAFTGYFNRYIQEQIKKWCTDQFGHKQGWQINWNCWRNQTFPVPSERDTYTFAFANRDDLTLFILVWAEHVL